MMTPKFISAVSTCIVLFFFPVLVFSQGLTTYVDPFLGCEIGNTVVGANTPFGMVKLSPDILPPNNTTGYKLNKPIIGFSHNHVSGTGGGARYGNILVIPQVGPLNIQDTLSTKYNEYAKPGYYGVTLGKTYGDVSAELTSTDHVGMHRYSFFILDKPKVREAYIFGHKKPIPVDANILIDISAIINSKVYEVAGCTGSELQIESDREITGHSEFSGGWGGDNPYQVYFVIQFDKPFHTSGTWKNDQVYERSTHQSGVHIGAFTKFKLEQNGTIQLKVGISYTSLAHARANLREIPDWDFDRVRNQADAQWNQYLGKVKVEGGTPEQKTIFYSALYHTMVMPVRLESNPGWKSDKPHYWDYYTLWDTYRTVMPLHTLILKERQKELVNCLLDIYDHKGWLPDAWTGGDYAMVQGGTSADVVIADAVVKGLKGIDYQKAYQAVKKNATQSSDNPFKYGRYAEYFTLGYCSSNIKNGSSKTLEYAYDDFCVAQVAQALGYTKDYQKFIKQSENGFNLFNPQSKYFWAKTDRGAWVEGFSPEFRMPDYWNGPYFYEGTPFSYSFYVPHDVARLIKSHGGDSNFIGFLDKLFDGKHFELGNEPGFLTPYLYTYAGRPDKTVERVKAELAEFKTGNIGLPGQDDSGAMSAWYVFGAMGFFPSAGQDLYLIGSPEFSKSTLDLGEGHTFRVIAKGLSKTNIYVQRATLNGKALAQAWFKHSDILKGGTLLLEMGAKPSKWGFQNPPPSITPSR